MKEVMEELLDITDHCTDHIKKQIEQSQRVSLEVAGVRMGMSAIISLVREREAKNREEVSEKATPDEKPDLVEEGDTLRNAVLEAGDRAGDLDKVTGAYRTKAMRKDLFRGTQGHR